MYLIQFKPEEIDKVWPLVGNDGNPLDIQFTGCPDSCNEWEWNSQISMI